MPDQIKSRSVDIDGLIRKDNKSKILAEVLAKKVLRIS